MTPTQYLDVRYTFTTRQGLFEVKLLHTLRFNVKNDEGKMVEVFVPAGFKTDFNSVPRWLRWLVNPYRLETLLASILHDYLLEKHIKGFRNRLTIDDAYNSEMRRAGLRGAKRAFRYIGVRIGSGRSFREGRDRFLDATGRG